MSNVYYELNFDDVKDIQDGRMRKRVNKAIAFGIRDELRNLEEYHKKRFFLRGSGKSQKTHKTKITWRTGGLAKSYQTYWKTGQHFGYYGTTLKRGALLEYGGTIRPVKAEALTIPTQAAKVGVGSTVSPKDFPKTGEGRLFRPRLPGGGFASVLARIGSGGKLEVMFILMKSVKIPARPTVKKTAAANVRGFEKRMAMGIAKAMEKKR